MVNDGHIFCEWAQIGHASEFQHTDTSATQTQNAAEVDEKIFIEWESANGLSRG